MELAIEYRLQCCITEKACVLHGAMRLLRIILWDYYPMYKASPKAGISWMQLLCVDHVCLCLPSHFNPDCLKGRASKENTLLKNKKPWSYKLGIMTFYSISNIFHRDFSSFSSSYVMPHKIQAESMLLESFVFKHFLSFVFRRFLQFSRVLTFILHCSL